jgi:hypothetical protein
MITGKNSIMKTYVSKK